VDERLNPQGWFVLWSTAMSKFSVPLDHGYPPPVGQQADRQNKEKGEWKTGWHSTHCVPCDGTKNPSMLRLTPVTVIMSSGSSSRSVSATISVPQGHVVLVLLQEVSTFYLQIPLGSLCLKSCKYLLFLGWCILGVEGVLALKNDDDGIDTDRNLDDRGIYYYIMAASLGMFSFTMPLLSCMHIGHLWLAICPTKILPMLLTLRS